MCKTFYNDIIRPTFHHGGGSSTMVISKKNFSSSCESFRMTNHSSNLSLCKTYIFHFVGVGDVSSTEKGALFGAYILVALLTVVLNAVVIKKLLTRKRAKSDNLFLILSISDFFVGVVSVPVQCLKFILKVEKYCLAQPWISVFQIFPFSFSWFLTVIISADRYVAILHPRIHGWCKKFNFTYKYIIFVFTVCASFAAASGWNTRRFMSLLSKPETSVNVFNLSVPLSELSCLLCTSFLHLHLYISVRRKTRGMDASRHTNNNSQRKLTITIAFMFFCAVVLNIPLLIFTFYELLTCRSRWNKVAMYQARNWTMLLTYTNSFWNSVILMRSSSFK